MKFLIRYAAAAFLLLLGCPTVRAEQLLGETSPSNPLGQAQVPTAVDLAAVTIRPRFGLELDTAGAGAEPYGQFEGFVPLWQTAGRDLGFLQGQLLFDIDANLGASLQLGYRRFVPESQRILGGYLSFDQRGTESASFSQLGAGLETLGKDWDLRLNGYLPVGDRRDLVDSSLVDAGLQLSNVQFVGHQLTASSRQQQGDVRRYEAALGGVDVEVGTKLLNIGDRGSLRGFGGLYYYDGPGVGGSLGWRLRLQAEPTEYLRTGLSVQDDDIFGTNIRFSIGATLPSNRATSAPPDEPPTEANRMLARLGESIGRVDHIVVDQQTEVDVVASGNIQSGPVINPATGQPWFFNHVTPGVSGDGTFEMPYGGVNEAIATIPTDGNGIIYVGDSGGTVFPGGFTVPGGVQLLSTGPAQFIAAFDDATQLQLPFSGSGNFPVIEGIVNLGSSPTAPTVFAGFDVQNNSLVLSDSLASADLMSFDSESGYGIFADNSLGEVVIRDNRVTAPETGIYVAAEDSTTAGSVTISGNTVSNARTGIEVSTENAMLTGDVAITGNTVSDAITGIGIVNDNATLTGDITLSENTIENGYSYGIELTSRDSSHDGDVVISGNTVDAERFGILANYSYSDLTGEMVISDNVIGADTAAYGGVIVFNDDSAVNTGITISGNTVDARSVGIAISNSNNSEIAGGIDISGNPDIQVTGTGRGGFIFGDTTAGIAVLNGNGSTVSEGVTVSANGPIQVTGDEDTPATGIVVFNYEGQIEGGVTISSNESIQVAGADTDRSNPGLPSPSDIGTVGIAVANASFSEASSTISGGVTISGNTDIRSTEYGIAAINSANNYSYDVSVIDNITIADNGVDSEDDSLLVVNTDQISGSVTLSNNLLTSVEDDGIDFSNLREVSRIGGDVVFPGNTINAAGDDIKCTNQGSIEGSTPSECLSP